MNFLNSLDTALGPMGWIAILGALGLTMVGATLVMILRHSPNRHPLRQCCHHPRRWPWRTSST